MAKAIEEEERNIGVAFIPPFTLTCVCVCACVCVFMSAPPSLKIECLDYSRTNKTEERYLFFVLLFSSVLLDFTSNAHITRRTIRERGRENVQ